MENRPGSGCTTYPFSYLVSDISRIEVREYKHIRPTSNTAVRRFSCGDFGDKRSIELKLAVYNEVWPLSPNDLESFTNQ